VTADQYTPWLFEGPNRLKVIPPCSFGQPVIDYYNKPEVRQKLHIPDHVQAFDFCTRNITYNKQKIGSEWAYIRLKGQYRMLHYSGDTDGAVPTLGTMEWMRNAGFSIKKEWRPYYVGADVGGYVLEYDGVTLGTVHGAGHMTPQFKPVETYHLIFNYIKGEDP